MITFAREHPLPLPLAVTDEVRRTIKAEAHKAWFDAFNPYCERVGIMPDVDVTGDEATTVREYVQQVMDPVLKNHQAAVQEIERLRAELARRGPSLSVVKVPDNG